MKKVLYSECNEERILGKEDTYPNLNKKSTNRESDSLLQYVYKKTINEVNLLNNNITINRIVNQIIKIEEMEFYSTGIAYSVLETVSHKLNSIEMEIDGWKNYFHLWKTQFGEPLDAILELFNAA